MPQNWLTDKMSYHRPEWIAPSDDIDPGSPVKPPEYRVLQPLSRLDAKYDLGSSAESWKYFWHPVATVKEFRSHTHTGKGPMSTVLLGQRIGAFVRLPGSAHARAMAARSQRRMK